MNINKRHIEVKLFEGILLLICVSGFIFSCAGQKSSKSVLETYICPTDYTQITYADGYYYFQSEADNFYLYRAKENGREAECLVQDAVKELYILDNWVYFTDLSEGSALYRVRTDGGEPEMVCSEEIKRFFPVGEMFFCLSEAENGIGRIFSCTLEGTCKELYQGKCDWICTDGNLIYAENRTGDEAQRQIMAMDTEGKVLQKYPYYECFIPTQEALYYYAAEQGEIPGQIISVDKETGKETCVQIPEGDWTGCDYTVHHGRIYVLCCSSQEYTAFRYDERNGTFTALHLPVQIAGEPALFPKIDNTVYFVNDELFAKVFVEDGKGQLWHCLGGTEGKAELFENMDAPVAVNTSLEGFAQRSSLYREGYLDTDIEYSENVGDDGQGHTVVMVITVPKIAADVPAAELINQKIREDAEQFYQEQNLFLADVKKEDTESEVLYGKYICVSAYAGEDYISLVYEKYLAANSGYSGGWEYVTKLYSSKTGEELELEDLFSVDFQRLFLRLSFLLRKTEKGFDCFPDDLFFRRGNYPEYRTYYCMTGEGLDVFFVEDMRTGKEYHFLISYSELQDIMSEAPEKSAREYEHWTGFHEDFDLPYANQAMVDILKEEYGKISFQGTFEQGDPEYYDEYKAYFLKLVNNEIPFTDMEMGEQRYLKDIRDLEDLGLFRGEALPASNRELYYFFDVDGDGAPELGIRNPYHHATQYIFRYDMEKEECFLWRAMEGSWYSLLGSRKVAWPWDGKYLSYEQLDAEGKVELSTLIVTNQYNEEESLYVVMLPEYREEDKKIEITALMREQGIYERSGERWFFRVTKEQAEELMAPYWDAYDRAEEQMEEVTYSYEELFGEIK